MLANYLGWKIRKPFVLMPNEYPSGPSFSRGANVSNLETGTSMPTIPANVWLSLSYTRLNTKSLLKHMFYYTLKISGKLLKRLLELTYSAYWSVEHRQCNGWCKTKTLKSINLLYNLSLTMFILYIYYQFICKLKEKCNDVFNNFQTRKGYDID